MRYAVSRDPGVNLEQSANAQKRLFEDSRGPFLLIDRFRFPHYGKR